ncbi:S41 family peptidase [Pseudoalteromonas luteoviolacea]|uniref:S41 family peptidase n=1 Tax=Pseudoalteromonas luteoviolacea TaxID=43657 RepID=UPI0011541188|nr:S41 family peptidase [Pseudoalteromonas luteoviolacea]TQF72393.1 carboxyl-terminal protease [Pseudoalteromonas luteoviolacea]
MRLMNKLYLAIGIAMTTTMLAGCGGSSGGGSSSNNNNNGVTPPAPQNTAPTWQAGQFLASNQFANLCESPRSGIDPFENTPYPDAAGTAMHEKMWLRSFSNETYLWYDEIIDNDPNQFSSVAAYFAQLKTPLKTASGRDKDEFHFSESYEDFKKESQDGVSASFGITWTIPQSRMAYVAYIAANSPAAQAGIKRGDRLLKVGDLDFATFNSSNSAQYNQIISAFSPAKDQTVELTLLAQNGEQKQVSLTALDLELEPVRNTQVIDFEGKRVGYMQFNQFIASAQPGLISGFSQFNNLDELVLDMRYNGGGLVFQASQVAYMIAGDQHNNRNFSVKTHNDKLSSQNEPLGFVDQSINWSTLTYNDDKLPAANMKRVYMLTTGGTASASESVINALRGIDIEVILIGDDTRGKPYGFVPQQNCGTVYYTIQNKSANNKGFGDYEDGFIITPDTQLIGEIGLDAKVPGCQISDDFSKALGDQSEGLLAGALHHMTTGSCPVSTERAARATIQDTGSKDMHNDFNVPYHPLRHGAIFTPMQEPKHD